jgi:glycine cleavage system transcriptional repressor
VAALTSRGYKVTTTPTDQNGTQAHMGWSPYRIEVHGADHEGIVHNIAHVLARKGISIESMDTGNTRAPNSGALLFSMNALVLVPPGLAEDLWRAELENTGDELHVDISITAES